MKEERIINALAMYKRGTLSANLLIEIVNKENKDITFLKNGDVIVQLGDRS